MRRFQSGTSLAATTYPALQRAALLDQSMMTSIAVTSDDDDDDNQYEYV